jgi:APA family basic amino acid/polyamine antiporter
MASDGLFFKRVAWLHPKTHAPVVAIALQGGLAIVVAISGKYEQILNYVVSIDSLFFGVTAACLFALRKQALRATDKSGDAARAFRVSAVVIVLFIAAEWLVAASAVYKDWHDSRIGLLILLAGVPVYFFWRRRSSRA